jgi:hypothetical protein
MRRAKGLDVGRDVYGLNLRETPDVTGISPIQKSSDCPKISFTSIGVSDVGRKKRYEPLRSSRAGSQNQGWYIVRLGYSRQTADG